MVYLNEKREMDEKYNERERGVGGGRGGGGWCGRGKYGTWCLIPRQPCRLYLRHTSKSTLSKARTGKGNGGGGGGERTEVGDVGVGGGGRE